MNLVQSSLLLCVSCRYLTQLPFIDRNHVGVFGEVSAIAFMNPYARFTPAPAVHGQANHFQEV